MTNERILEIDFDNVEVTFVDAPPINTKAKATSHTVALADITIDKILTIRGFAVRSGEIRTANGEKQESIVVRFPESYSKANGRTTLFWIDNRDIQEKIKDIIWQEYANYVGNLQAGVAVEE
jgi:DNA-binding cell septation regulator SpoVG